MNFRSINDLTVTIDQYLPRFHEMKPTAIVGIPRSGMLAASIVALKMNLPLLTIEQFYSNSAPSNGITRKLRNVHSKGCYIVLDDSYNTGRSIKEQKSRIESKADEIGVQTYVGVVYSSSKAPSGIDFYIEHVPQPRMFEWNMFHSFVVERTMFDIDGVLCVDPTKKETVTQSLYREFLNKTLPLFLYTGKAKAIVSSRLEEDRSATVNWLERHSLEYEELVLSKYNSVEERRKAADHGIKKGEIYRESNAELFVESELKQALDICRVSGKYVFCTENNRLISPFDEETISLSHKVFLTMFKSYLKRYSFLVKLNSVLKGKFGG